MDIIQRYKNAIAFQQNLLRSHVLSKPDREDIQFTIDVLSSHLTNEPARVAKPEVKAKTYGSGFASFNNIDLFVMYVSLHKLWYSMANQQDNPIYDTYITMYREVEDEMKKRGINAYESIR